MAAAHGGVQHLEIEGRPGRGPGGRARRGARLWGGGRSLRFAGPGLEGVQALLDQRLEGLIDDEVHQILRGVEATAVLAGVGVGADADLAVGAAHRLLFQQAFVDGAELLDGHVAVVDVAGLTVGLGVAEAVDHVGHDVVGQADLVQQGSGVVGKQAAVVGREADGRVALVDLREEIGQVTVVARCGTGEGVAAGRARATSSRTRLRRP